MPRKGERKEPECKNGGLEEKGESSNPEVSYEVMSKKYKKRSWSEKTMILGRRRSRRRKFKTKILNCGSRKGKRGQKGYR